jgi:cell division protease FtsH
MSEKMGHLTYGKPLTGRFLQSPFTAEERNYSEKTAEAIDEEVHKVIDECYGRSRDILLSRHAQLESIAKELIVKETLDRAALDELVRTTEPQEAATRGRDRSGVLGLCPRDQY